MMGLKVTLYNCVSLYNDKVFYLASDLTIYSSVSNDAQHLPLHIRMVTNFLPWPLHMLLLGKSLQLLLIGHHKANHVWLITGKEMAKGQ